MGSFIICILYLIYIYIKANRAGFVCVLLGEANLAGFVCVLLELLSESGWVCVRVARRRSELLCSGGVFFVVRSGAQQWGGFSLGSVPRTRWWANVAFPLRSVFQKRIIFGGAEIAQKRPAESMAGETSSRPTIAGFEIL
jgi:hypothetical protein